MIKPRSTAAEGRRRLQMKIRIDKPAKHTVAAQWGLEWVVTSCNGRRVVIGRKVMKQGGARN